MSTGKPAIARLDSTSPDFPDRLRALLHYEAGQDAAIEATVAGILADVRERGDEALLEHTRRLDRVEVARAADLEVPAAELRRALDTLPGEQRDALRGAAERIRAFHERQLASSWSYTEADGTLLGQQVQPIDRVGVYVPGGKAAYPSSVLMNLLPA
ncbi:MAG: histidinol dehydrogenase, partial [Gemmatimonadales bacterium]|nr:histidinol dehydrogenase [Gemmatimonadales bacterium]